MVATKVLRERNIPVQCYEKGSDVGGLWRFNNDSGTSAAYESLHINSSRQLMAFSDFAMDPSLPDFPHHSHILKYFEDYANHFGIRESTSFKTSVGQVHALEEGGYRVNFIHRERGPSSECFDSVIVANGHHWSKKMPAFNGDFSGESIHAHDYKSAEPFRGKNVLVVGIGNSGVDIACELSRIAKQTVLSTRRGAHVIPKYLLGKPLDRVASKHFWTLCPLWLRQRLFAALLKMTRGRQSRYGMPEPDYRVLQEHPTVSSELLNLLGHGKITIKPDVNRLAADKVHFVDQTTGRFDAIIYATGYNIRFPFLDQSMVNTENNEVSLYKHVVHPGQPGLFFVGLVQPWGPLMPLAEAQSEWIGDLLEHAAKLPDEKEMIQSIRKQQKSMQKRYVKSSRHTIQVDFYPYLFDIRKQRKRRKGMPALNHEVLSTRGSAKSANEPLGDDGSSNRAA